MKEWELIGDDVFDDSSTNYEEIGHAAQKKLWEWLCGVCTDEAHEVHDEFGCSQRVICCDCMEQLKEAMGEES